MAKTFTICLLIVLLWFGLVIAQPWFTGGNQAIDPLTGYKFFKKDDSGTTWYIMFIARGSSGQTGAAWFINAFDTGDGYRASYAFVTGDTNYNSAVSDMSNHYFRAYDQVF